MHRIARFLAPIVAASAIALAGGSQALADSPSSSSLDNQFCFNDVTVTSCFDMDGTMQLVETPNGAASLSVHLITRTTYFESGIQTGETKAVENARTTIDADGNYVARTVLHSKTRSGEGTCTYKLVLHIVDFEPIVIHDDVTCGG